jgi:integrase
MRRVKHNLTDRFIASRKPAKPGDRDHYYDALVPGMMLRVTDTGHKSFCLAARFPLNPRNPTKRALGDVGAITLADARQKAREWLALVTKGIDPKIEEERLRAEAKRRQDTTIGVVADEYVARHVSKLAKEKEVKGYVEAFVKRVGKNRPIEFILPADISQAIRAVVENSGEAVAHNVFSNLRHLFNWTLETGEFGITVSPMANLKPKSLIGERKIGDRWLRDHELRAVWQATGDDFGPAGAAVRLLIISACRLNEIVGLSWKDEIDLDKLEIIIPARRMKNKLPHLVPITPEIERILREIPRWRRGDFVFTTTGGRVPITVGSKLKQKLNAIVGFDDWRWHDLRRTARVNFSKLPIEEPVREALLSHVKEGLKRVYNPYNYTTEKRNALVIWETALAKIVNPSPPASVTDLDAVRRSVAGAAVTAP